MAAPCNQQLMINHQLQFKSFVFVQIWCSVSVMILECSGGNLRCGFVPPRIARCVYEDVTRN